MEFYKDEKDKTGLLRQVSAFRTRRENRGTKNRRMKGGTVLQNWSKGAGNKGSKSRQPHAFFEADVPDMHL